jgi:hypothetical protein
MLLTPAKVGFSLSASFGCTVATRIYISRKMEEISRSSVYKRAAQTQFPYILPSPWITNIYNMQKHQNGTLHVTWKTFLFFNMRRLY